MSIGKNMLAGMATNVVVFGLGILLSVVLTRSLGAEGRGIYALLVTTYIVLTNVLNLSLGAACTTFLAKGQYALGAVNTVAAILALLWGVLGLAAVSLAFPYLQASLFHDVPYRYLLVALLLLPLAIYQLYWNAMMVGLNRVRLVNKFSLGQNLGNTALMLLLVGALHLGIPGFLLGWATSVVVAAVGMVVLAARARGFAWPPQRAVFRDMVSFGIRGHGAGIAHHLFLDLDVYIIKILVGTTGLGYYSLAVSLAEKLWVPLDAINASAIGKVAQLPKRESALLTAKVTRTALLLVLAGGIPLAVVSPWLIPFLYGADFATAVLPLIVLLFGIPAFAVMLMLNSYIVGHMQRPGLLSIVSWLELAVSIPLYVGLIAWQGIVGAALASTLTYVMAMAGTLYLFVRDSGLPAHLALVPRRSDFHDYARVLRSVAGRVPGLNRYAGRLS